MLAKTSSGTLVTLGNSEWFNENLNEAGMVDNVDTIIIERLRVANALDSLSESDKLTETYVLKMRFSKKMQTLLQSLK